MSGLDTSLWRAAAAFRWLTVAYVSVTNLLDLPNVAHRPTAVVLVVVMVGWTVITTVAYARPELRLWPLLVADLAVAVGLILATWLVEPASRILAGEPTFPQMWVASVVLAWAICWQMRGGVLAAATLAVADLVEREALRASTVNNVALLLLAGVVVGYLVGLGRRGEAALAEAVRLSAATAERQRLSRRIHDGVLQVLALVQRRGSELGGEAAELGRLAGEQEQSLRGLVAVSADPAAAGSAPAGGMVDLREALGTVQAGPHVHLAAPATPVLLEAHRAEELLAAAGEAVHNIRRHVAADADAWLLLEDDGAEVVLTVRDDGPGIAPGRLAQARAEGRLGVEQSVRGRLRDLGGRAEITSTAGQGTEVELRVPR
ncbi:MAG: DUF5931 domain-containing protein [Actinomycetota bacterium]|nr:DUF5931 domain-containing protein [Actinomycetota bacterium]